MCDCLKKVNKELAAYNVKVATGFLMTKEMGLRMRVLIAAEKLDKTKRKPSPQITAAFCPFCGTKAE